MVRLHFRNPPSAKLPTAHCSANMVPSLTDDYTDIFVDNVHIELSLWDTAGQEEFDRLRSLSYGTLRRNLSCISILRQPEYTLSTS